MLRLFRGPITGRKFFAIFSSFFLTIIAVNLVLAFKAVETFPGLEVANSYVASQKFDDARAAQEALGWDASARVENGELLLTLTGPDGRPVDDAEVGGTFGRATEVWDDQTPDFAFDGAVWRAPVDSDGGNWNLRLEATAADGTLFKQRLFVRSEG